MTNETDRELLELAAKAAGLSECGWMADTFTHVVDNRFVFGNHLQTMAIGTGLRGILGFPLTSQNALFGSVFQTIHWFKNTGEATAVMKRMPSSVQPLKSGRPCHENMRPMQVFRG